MKERLMAPFASGLFGLTMFSSAHPQASNPVVSQIPRVSVVLSVQTPAAGKADSPPRYQVRELKGADDANAINDKGQVVGVAGRRAFLWQQGRLRLLSRRLDFDSATAQAINVHGDVVGSNFRVRSGALTRHESVAVVWRRGRKMHVLPCGGSNIEARAINAAGLIVGVSSPADNMEAGYVSVDTVVWRNGKTRGFELIEANGVNTRGIIVGSAAYLSESDREEKKKKGVVCPDLGDALVLEQEKVRSLGHGVATAINDLGQIVGHSDRGGVIIRTPENDPLPADSACLWAAGVQIILGRLPGDRGSNAYAINNKGDIVGEVVNNMNRTRAVLWRNKRPYDLNTLVSDPKWELDEARGINNQGWIVGHGTHNGHECAYVLIPVLPQQEARVKVSDHTPRKPGTRQKLTRNR